MPPPPGYPGSGSTMYGQPPPYGSSYGYAGAYGQQMGTSAGGMYGKPQPHGVAAGNMDGYDFEAQQAAAASAAFAETKVRSAFVRKVFLLVFLQLAMTIGIACVFMFVKPVREYVAGTTEPCPFDPSVQCYQAGDGRWVFYVSWALTLVTLIALMCSTTLRRKHPWNYIAMFTFTFVMSVQVGCIVAFWNVAVVLEAFAITGAAVFGLTMAAIFIPWDITKKGHILAMAAMVVFFMALVTIIVGFFYANKWWYLALSCVIALLFAAFLVYDIQMVVGNGQHKISPDEYVFAAVQIYLDIIILFLNVCVIVTCLACCCMSHL